MSTSPAFQVVESIAAILGAAAAAGTFLVAVVFIIRGGSYQKLAEQWKELALVKAEKIKEQSEKIEELEGRISHLESEIAHLRDENEELRKLNIDLQRKRGKIDGD